MDVWTGDTDVDSLRAVIKNSGLPQILVKDVEGKKAAAAAKWAAVFFFFIILTQVVPGSERVEETHSFKCFVNIDFNSRIVCWLGDVFR